MPFTLSYRTYVYYNIVILEMSRRAFGFQRKPRCLRVSVRRFYTVAGLAAITKDGIATVRAALNELEANGYLSRKRVRGEDGKLENNEYTFYEIPRAGKPAQETPEQETPAEDLPA